MITQIDRTSFKTGEIFQNAIDTVDTKIGSIGNKFYPQFDVDRWNGEGKLGIRLKEGIAFSKHVLENNRVTWIRGDGDLKTEIYQYGKEERSGIKMDVYLANPVAYLDFEMDMQNVEAFKQPPLAEADLGCSQPEWVTNSYVFMHSVKRVMGSTWKLGQLYRPIIYDKLGRYMYGEWEYLGGGNWRSHIPQPMLDKGIVPLRVDPYWGYNTVGGSIWQLFVGSGYNTEIIACSEFTAAAGVPSRIEMYSFSGLNYLAACNVYEAGQSVALFPNGETTVFAENATPAWWGSTFKSGVPAFVGGSKYKLAAFGDATFGKLANVGLNVYYDILGTENNCDQFKVWAVPPDWTVASWFNSGRTISIRVLYTPASHDITASSGSHGSIDPTGVVTVDDGDDQAFDLIPDAGYQVDVLTVDGAPVAVQDPYTFYNVVTDHTIDVTFTGIPVDALGGRDRYCLEFGDDRNLLLFSDGRMSFEMDSVRRLLPIDDSRRMLRDTGRRVLPVRYPRHCDSN